MITFKRRLKKNMFWVKLNTHYCRVVSHSDTQCICKTDFTRGSLQKSEDLVQDSNYCANKCTLLSRIIRIVK